MPKQKINVYYLTEKEMEKVGKVCGQIRKFLHKENEKTDRMVITDMQKGWRW